MKPSSSPALPRNLALAWSALICYACLHPFSGWYSSGLPALDYLLAPWPKYFILNDLLFNIAGYLPFGLLVASSLVHRHSRARSVLLTALLATLLSFSLETLQNFLPSRVASNLDIAGNLIGASLGALLGAGWGKAWFGRGGLVRRWRENCFIRGRSGDAGLILLGLWLLAQLSVHDLLFSSGDLRRLLGIAAPLPFSAERFIAFDSALTASAMLGVGLLARCMIRTPNPAPLLILLALGVAAKALSSTVFFASGSALTWLTPGASRGLLIGTPLLLLGLLLPRLIQHALAGTALLTATALVNIMPDNPYLPYHQQLNQISNILNFHGLTELVNSLWPFAALAYLSALGLWRGEHLSARRRGESL